MTTIHILSIATHGQEPRLSYHASRSSALKEKDMKHETYIMRHLLTANKIKGAIRGKGQGVIHSLAAGIVAEDFNWNITKVYLHGLFLDAASIVTFPPAGDE